MPSRNELFRMQMNKKSTSTPSAQRAESGLKNAVTARIEAMGGVTHSSAQPKTQSSLSQAVSARIEAMKVPKT